MRRRVRGRTAQTLGRALALMVAPVLAQAMSPSPPVATGPQDGEVDRYWTPERMGTARPYPMPTPDEEPGRGDQPAPPSPDTPPVASPSAPPSHTTDR